jgi:hypothetical protein
VGKFPTHGTTSYEFEFGEMENRLVTLAFLFDSPTSALLLDFINVYVKVPSPNLRLKRILGAEMLPGSAENHLAGAL